MSRDMRSCIFSASSADCSFMVPLPSQLSVSARALTVHHFRRLNLAPPALSFAYGIAEEFVPASIRVYRTVPTVEGGAATVTDDQVIWRGMSHGCIMLAPGLPPHVPQWRWTCNIYGKPGGGGSGSGDDLDAGGSSGHHGQRSALA
jgi:hypothetical protein